MPVAIVYIKANCLRYTLLSYNLCLIHILICMVHLVNEELLKCIKYELYLVRK